MRVDPSIFKAYDIRGHYPKQINTEFSYHLGRAVATYLSAKRLKHSEYLNQNYILTQRINSIPCDRYRLSTLSDLHLRKMEN